MKVALHSTPNDFFKSKPPHSSKELFKLVRKAASLGFRCFQIGPLWSFMDIDARGLRSILNRYRIDCNVHVGGRYDAEKFAALKKEYERVQKEIHCGIELCRDICSTLVSFHPPFFMTEDVRSKALLLKAQTRFRRLVTEEVDFASENGIQMALESFCYHPFIFNSLHDFTQLISCVPSTKLGVLLEVGHLFHVGHNLDNAIQTFNKRLLDVHIHDATLGGDVRKATHLPIGKGSVDFPGLIKALRRVSYGGWLTIEIRGNEKQIVESKEYLEILIKTVA